MKRGMSPKKDNKQEQGEKEDYISNLPDDVLVLILNKLPWPEATRTSVISHRWMKLWTFVTNLDFLDFFNTANIRLKKRKRETKTIEFINRVNESLTRYRSKTTDNFRVFFGLDSKYSNDIDKWIEFAARKGAKKLQLDLSPNQRRLYCFPDVEKIRTCRMSITSLKEICLKRVIICTETIDYILSNCSLLERLCIQESSPSGYGNHYDTLSFTGSLKNLKYLEISNIYDLEIFSPDLSYLEINSCSIATGVKIAADSLEYLIISDCPRMTYFNISSQNLVSLNLSLPDTVLSAVEELFAPNLVSLRCFAIVIDTTFIENLPLLSELSANYSPQMFYIPYGHHYFTQLKILRLCIPKKSSAYVVDNFLDRPQISTNLGNLQQFELTVELLHQEHCFLWPCLIIKSAPLLQRFKLQILSFKEYKSDLEKPTKDLWGKSKTDKRLDMSLDIGYMQRFEVPKKIRRQKKVIEHGSHKHLKRVEFIGFTGHYSQVDLVQQLFEIAISLEQMLIYAHFPISQKSQHPQLARHHVEFLTEAKPSRVDLIFKYFNYLF